jgi:hypothetical protein
VMGDFKLTLSGVCKKAVMWKCYNRYNFTWATEYYRLQSQINEEG